MLDQAVNRTAVVTVGDVRNDDKTLSARVTVISKVGHKFPSGVGFRRAFLQFSVLDVNNKVLWSSGRTDGAGVIVDENNDADRRRVVVDARTARRGSTRRRASTSRTIRRSRGRTRRRSIRSWSSTPADATTPICGPDAKPQGQLTTSFLSICAKVKDNRILPQGFLKLDGAHRDFASSSAPTTRWRRKPAPTSVGNDPGLRERGGSDSLVYRVPLAELAGKPAAVQATLYYQPTPPFYLQDRFCTSNSNDTKRLYYSPASSTSPARRRRTGSCAWSPAGR